MVGGFLSMFTVTVVRARRARGLSHEASAHRTPSPPTVTSTVGDEDRSVRLSADFMNPPCGETCMDVWVVPVQPAGGRSPGLQTTFRFTSPLAQLPGAKTWPPGDNLASALIVGPCAFWFIRIARPTISVICT